MYEIAKKMSQNKVVMTIEDPVEIHESSFLQAQVNNEAGIDYQNLKPLHMAMVDDARMQVH